MKLPNWLLLVVLTLFFNQAHAQTACPPGMEEYGAGVCGYSRSDEPAQQQAPSQQAASPPARWATRWGAIATDGVKGSLGTTTGVASREEAERTAMSDCKAKGGSRCKLDVAYDNECAAMVVGSKGYSVNAASTVDAASQIAMKICSADGDATCHVYYSACSPPVRIQ